MSSTTPVPFLFQSLDATRPLSCRKIHICRLYDILQLSLLRNDLARARQAWGILARCKEMNWMSLWPTAVRILGDDTFDENDASRKLEFLHEIHSEYAEQRESILKEIVLRQILAGRLREALDELELYLPSFPYQDNPILHTYAGLLCLYMAQPEKDSMDTDLNPSYLNSARAHFQGAISLDPSNSVANHFFQRVAKLTGEEPESEDDEEVAMHIVPSSSPRRKRVRLQKKPSG